MLGHHAGLFGEPHQLKFNVLSPGIFGTFLNERTLRLKPSKSYWTFLLHDLNLLIWCCTLPHFYHLVWPPDLSSCAAALEVANCLWASNNSKRARDAWCQTYPLFRKILGRKSLLILEYTISRNVNLREQYEDWDNQKPELETTRHPSQLSLRCKNYDSGLPGEERAERWPSSFEIADRHSPRSQLEFGGCQSQTCEDSEIVRVLYIGQPSRAPSDSSQ